MNPKRIFVFVDRWGMQTLAFLTGLSFLLAVWDSVSAAGSDSTGIRALWTSVMHTVNSDPDESEGWEGHMHLFFKATVGWAAARVYMATAGLKWDTFAARWLARSHVVIVAGQSTGKTADSGAHATSTGADEQVPFAIDLALAIASSEPVVLALPDIDEGARTKLWDAGVSVISADMSMPDLLQATGASRAHMLIAMRDSALDNIVLSRIALSAAFGNPGLQSKCLIEPLRYKLDLRLEDYFEAGSLARIRVFSQTELVARRLVSAFPPDAPVATSAEPVHVVLVGLGSVGQAVVLQLARQGHYRSGIKPRVTVVDRVAKQRWAELSAVYPALSDWLDISLEEARLETLSAQTVTQWASDDGRITMVYVCTRDEVANLRVSRVMLDALRMLHKQGRTQPARVIALDPPGGTVLTDFFNHGLHEDRFEPFALVDLGREEKRSSVVDGLLDDLDDSRARQFHQAYHDKELLKTSAPLKPAAKSWESLEETYRNANRATADHFDVKLRAVGRRLCAKGAQEAAPLTQGEIELLARMEHQRWWADRALDGWKFGKRNDALKLHDNMLPYDELTEEIRQYDRDAVIGMVTILEREGFVLLSDHASAAVSMKAAE